MKLIEKYYFLISYFEKNLPNPETELHFSSPFELAVAVVLSAQCTDKRVNIITPQLLKKYPTPQKMALASTEDIYKLIKSCSYPNNKAKNILGMSKALVENHDGVLPESTEELQELPGIGRKTAHVLASVLYNKPTLAVDTHVFRVAARIGLTRNAKNPLQCEQQIMKHLAPEHVHSFHHWLILHGRYVCKARKPACDECGIKQVCNYFKKLPKTV